MTPTHTQLAKIHIAKKELQLTDDIYRDILALHFKTESATELTNRQAEQLLDIFRAKGWQSKKVAFKAKRRDGNFLEIKPGPTAAQQRKVLAMWNALGYGIDKLHVRCKRQFGVDRFEWLTDPRQLHILITDLEQRQEKARVER